MGERWMLVHRFIRFSITYLFTAPRCISGAHSCSEGSGFPAIVLKHKAVSGARCVGAVMKPVWEPIASLSPQLCAPEDHVF